MQMRPEKKRREKLAGGDLLLTDLMRNHLRLMCLTQTRLSILQCENVPDVLVRLLFNVIVCKHFYKL